MNQQRFLGSRAPLLGSALAARVMTFSCASLAHAVVKSDDFSDPSSPDFGGAPTNADGTFTGGPIGIWDGSWNMANLAGGSFDSNFTDTNALHIDDNNVTNIGWEGGRSTAPLLWTTVPAGKDFTATIKSHRADCRFLVGSRPNCPRRQFANSAWSERRFARSQC